MKTQKRLFIFFATVSIVNIILLFGLEYLQKGIVNIQFLNGRREFYINILMGIFGGTLIATLTAYITYKNERENLISTIVNCLMAIYDNLMYLWNRVELSSNSPKIVIDREIDYDVEHINIILSKCRFLLYDIKEVDSLINKRNKEKFKKMYEKVRNIHCWGSLLSRELRNPPNLKYVIDSINGINKKINLYIDIEENIKDMGGIINNKRQQIKFEKQIDEFRENHPNYKK